MACMAVNPPPLYPVFSTTPAECIGVCTQVLADYRQAVEDPPVGEMQKTKSFWAPTLAYHLSELLDILQKQGQ